MECPVWPFSHMVSIRVCKGSRNMKKSETNFGYDFIQNKAYLVFYNGGIISKPCILPLCLAVSETWIYEYPILSRHCETLYSIKHLVPKSCSKELADFNKSIKLLYHNVANLNIDLYRWFVINIITLEKLNLWWRTLHMVLFAFTPIAMGISWWWS